METAWFNIKGHWVVSGIVSMNTCKLGHLICNSKVHLKHCANMAIHESELAFRSAVKINNHCG